MIIVTGCAGFIGSALTRKLLDSGYTVTGVDNDQFPDWSNAFAKIECEVESAKLVVTQSYS